MVAKKIAKRVTTETIDEEGNRKTVVKEHPVAEVKTQGKRKAGPKKMTAREREELLIENFVGLQHAMTNMSIKFGALSDNISKLLHIFEESARNFVSGGRSDDEEMLSKIDSLLNQNKTIAKGLVLMEGKLRGKNNDVSSMSFAEGENPRMKPSMSQQQVPSNFSNRPKPLPSI